MTRPEPGLTAEEIDSLPPATLAEWLEPRPDDLHPEAFEPRYHPEPVPELEAGTPQGYAAWIPDPAPSLDDPRYRGLGGWRHPDRPRIEPRVREPGAREIRPPEPEPEPEASL